MAYWQNGKVYVNTGSQRTAQTLPGIAAGRRPSPNVVDISEYTRGGFGSKITGAISLSSPRCCRKRWMPP